MDKILIENGKYFTQKEDVKDRIVIEAATGINATLDYWRSATEEEINEYIINYQFKNETGRDNKEN